MNADELLKKAEKVPYQYWWQIEALIESAVTEEIKRKLYWIMRRKELLEQATCR